MRQLVTTENVNATSHDDAIVACLGSSKTGFWLDIEDPDESDLALLRSRFHFHPLTIEDIEAANQRPKLEEFDDYVFLVLFSADWDGRRVGFREHHLYISGRFLVSVHREPEPGFDRVRQRIRDAPELKRKSLPFFFYLVVNQIAEGLFPVLEKIDDVADELEDEILSRATPEVLSTITGLKRATVVLRKVLGAQRDVFQRLTTRAVQDQSSREMAVYFRDVYDHIVRQYENVDSMRDLLTSSMDVYLSTVSNRLNDIVRRLTVFATLFLPLTFITGFFGMNFGWMVKAIAPLTAFAIGVAAMVVTAGVQLFYFWRRGWF
jgi:magnesium transporter